MSESSFGEFSVYVALKYDVDAVELEYIMAAEGLTEDSPRREITEAIGNLAHWTPAGPIYNWEAIIAKAESNGYTPD